jgi:hypothetical protein
LNEEAILFKDSKEIEHLEKAHYCNILHYNVFKHCESWFELMADPEASISDINEKGGHLGPVEDAFGQVSTF